MIVIAWNNGAHHFSGAGYGLKIAIEDRDRYFLRKWKTAILDLEGNPKPVEVNVDKDSFWDPTCRELISKDIGIWMLKNGLAPWPKGKPPKLEMQPAGERHFKVNRKPV